jgi:hypothetical protein
MEGSEFRDYLDSPGLRMGGQLERCAKRKSCGPVEIIGTLNATAMSPVKLKDRKLFLPINSDFDLSESSKNPKPEKQELPKALNVPKIGILGPLPSETLEQKKMTKPLGILSNPNSAKKETDLTINSNNKIIRVQPIRRSGDCSDIIPPRRGSEGRKRLTHPRIDTPVIIGLKSKTVGGQ